MTSGSMKFFHLMDGTSGPFAIRHFSKSLRSVTVCLLMLESVQINTFRDEPRRR